MKTFYISIWFFVSILLFFLTAVSIYKFFPKVGDYLLNNKWIQDGIINNNNKIILLLKRLFICICSVYFLCLKYRGLVLIHNIAITFSIFDQNIWYINQFVLMFTILISCFINIIYIKLRHENKEKISFIHFSILIYLLILLLICVMSYIFDMDIYNHTTINNIINLTLLIEVIQILILSGDFDIFKIFSFILESIMVRNYTICNISNNENNDISHIENINNNLNKEEPYRIKKKVRIVEPPQNVRKISTAFQDVMIYNRGKYKEVGKDENPIYNIKNFIFPLPPNTIIPVDPEIAMVTEPVYVKLEKKLDCDIEKTNVKGFQEKSLETKIIEGSMEVCLPRRETVVSTDGDLITGFTYVNQMERRKIIPRASFWLHHVKDKELRKLNKLSSSSLKNNIYDDYYTYLCSKKRNDSLNSSSDCSSGVLGIDNNSTEKSISSSVKEKKVFNKLEKENTKTGTVMHNLKNKISTLFRRKQ